LVSHCPPHPTARERRRVPEALAGPTRRGAHVPLTRQFGRGLLEYLKVAREDIGDVKTIVTELVADVVRHAQSVDGRSQVLLEYHAERVVITVVDAGEGFAVRDVSKVGNPRADLEGGERLGGFGLPLLDALSDRLRLCRMDTQGTPCAPKSRCATRRKETPTTRRT